MNGIFLGYRKARVPSQDFSSAFQDALYIDKLLKKKFYVWLVDLIMDFIWETWKTKTIKSLRKLTFLVQSVFLPFFSVHCGQKDFNEVYLWELSLWSPCRSWCRTAAGVCPPDSGTWRSRRSRDAVGSSGPENSGEFNCKNRVWWHTRPQTDRKVTGRSKVIKSHKNTPCCGKAKSMYAGMNDLIFAVRFPGGTGSDHPV